MIKIGDFSKFTRISIRMLRHYNEIGLLIPDTIDESNGYRYYSETQLDKANKITALKFMGFSLNTISGLLSSNESDLVKERLLKRKEELIHEGELIKEKLRLLENTINRFELEDYLMKYTVNSKEMPSRKVASLRKTIPSYNMEGILWGELMNSGPDIKIAYPCYSTAIFHDGEYKESDVDVEIQISVKELGNSVGNVEFKEVPAQKIVSCVFKGSYNQINDVTESIISWSNQNNIELAGPMFNIYLVGPYEEKNPANFVTEVCFPVK
ncbi:MerR family transcriptional regulator [Clostridium sp. CCUG 7971]|uniref:MerR family transcriptional regulator n=1 Tax=Clostridium sp. CCUG 7971 TaxID=2811414 RepID=UPI001ABAFB53|nr:MerR family transcriptional regulator [Clostridium sp. CCUG 7971]MBO3443868.1 MerR family transcriptional regulator [Clostridium sp. CCUG 7971]